MATQSHSPTILLTRPLAQSQRFAALLAAVTDVPVLIAPLMETVFLQVTLPARSPSAIILTSEAGARAATRLKDRLPNRAWCVGDRTAEVARQAGFAAQSAQGDAAALVAAILRAHEVGPLLHLRGAATRGEVANLLTKGGIVTDEVVVYDQQEQPLSPEAWRLIRSGRPVIVPLFSPRSAAIFARQVGRCASLWLAAFSPAVAAELGQIGAAGLETADRPDAQGMLLAVQRLIDAACGS